MRILGVDLEGSWLLASTALVVVWTAMYLTRYSDYPTGFRESGAERQKNRIKYITHRKRYRTLLKDKKQTYKTEKVKNLLDKRNDSKQFWKEVRSVDRVAQQQPDISELEWTNHFKSALGTEPTSAQPVVIDEEDPSVDVLDSPITEEEIMRAVEHLKTSKAPGTDGIYWPR